MDKLAFPHIGVRMRLSTKRVALGISVLILPFIFAPKADALPVVKPHRFLLRFPVQPREMALSHPKAYALKLLKVQGIAKEYGCLVELWSKESHWRYKDKNPHSTATGIAQLLIETSFDPARQIRDGLKYINYRYQGSPCRALAWHRIYGWY